MKNSNAYALWKSFNEILKKYIDNENNLPIEELFRKNPGCEDTDESEISKRLNSYENYKMTDTSILLPLHTTASVCGV